MTSKKNTWKGSIFIIILFFIAFISILGFIWSFSNYRSIKSHVEFLSSQTTKVEMTDKDIEDLVAKVETHIILPTDIKPNVATVLDETAFTEDQVFFHGAKNGDRVLFYKDRVILYRPDRDIIVNVASVQTSASTKEVVVPVEPQLPKKIPISIEIRNGSVDDKQFKDLSNLVRDNGEYKIVETGNISDNNYSSNLIVNLKNKSISDIQEIFHANVTTTIPENESLSEADILIIIGN